MNCHRRILENLQYKPKEQLSGVSKLLEGYIWGGDVTDITSLESLILPIIDGEWMPFGTIRTFVISIL
jgi:hypothetical protein